MNYVFNPLPVSTVDVKDSEEKIPVRRIFLCR